MRPLGSGGLTVAVDLAKRIARRLRYEVRRPRGPLGRRLVDADAATPEMLRMLGDALRSELESHHSRGALGLLVDGARVPLAKIAAEAPEPYRALRACNAVEESGRSARCPFRAHVIDGVVVLTDPDGGLKPLARAPLWVDPLWEAPLLADLIDRTRTRRGLDMGCGSGILSLVLARVCDEVVGVDVNPRAVALARLNARLNSVGNVTFREGDLFGPVTGERFDRVLFSTPTNVEGEEYRSLLETGEPLLERFFADVSQHLDERGLIEARLAMNDYGNSRFRDRLERWLGPQLPQWRIAILVDDRHQVSAEHQRKTGLLVARRGRPAAIIELDCPYTALGRAGAQSALTEAGLC